MQKKSIQKNYLYNAIYQALLMITPLITAPYLSRILEPDGIGMVSYTGSMVSYFILFATMGIPIHGQRETSYVQDSVEKRSVVFWNIKILSFCVSSVVTVVYLIYALWQKEASVLYLILTLNLVSVVFDITWFFQGMEEFGKIVTRNIVLKCFQIAYVFTFVKSKDDLLIYVFGFSLFAVLAHLSLWAYLPKYIKMIPRSQLHPFRDIKIVWSLFIPTIAIQIYTVLDKTMIGIITRSSFENGYYEQAIKLSKMLLALVTAMGTVMVPRIGYHFGKNDMGEIRRLMYRGYRFVWFLGVPLCIGTIMTAGNFVPWFFGPGYEKVVVLLGILSFLIPVIGISNVTGIQYFIPTKRQNLFTLSVVIGACTNFVLNMILIRFFQSLGAAIASVAGESSVTIALLVLARKELSPRQTLKEGVHYCIAAAVMALVLWPLSKALSPSMAHTVMMVICGAATYACVLLIERDEFFLSIVKTVLQKLRQMIRI